MNEVKRGQVLVPGVRCAGVPAGHRLLVDLRGEHRDRQPVACGLAQPTQGLGVGGVGRGVVTESVEERVDGDHERDRAVGRAGTT